MIYNETRVLSMTIKLLSRISFSDFFLVLGEIICQKILLFKLKKTEFEQTRIYACIRTLADEYVHNLLSRYL